MTPCLRLALLSLLFLSACAPPLKDPWGLAVLRGDSVAEESVPRTVQADLTVVAHNPDTRASTMPVSSRLYAEPGRRYRLDVFGLFTPVVASWAWQADGWRLVRHDTRTVITGTGTSFISLAASGRPLVIPDVHAMLGFLWGQPLPGFTSALVDTSPGRGVVAWTQGGTPWRARFDPATGLCLEASSPDMTLRYGRYERQGARAVPREIEVWIEDARVLTLSVRARRENPAWARDPFVLTIPPGYDSTAVR